MYIFVSTSQTVSHAASSKFATFWDSIGQAQRKHSQVQEYQAQVNSYAAQFEMLDWWEDPSIEVSSNQRNNLNPSMKSRVDSFTLRQPIPFGSQKRRMKPAYKARLESLQNQLSSIEQQLESELILKVYHYAKFIEEMKYMKKRRERLQSAKKNLAKRKSSSPAYELEKELILSSIKISEQQFDQNELEVKRREAELKVLGIDVQSRRISLSWFSPEKFSAFIKQVDKNNPKKNFYLESQKLNVIAAQKEQDSLSAFPEIDLFLQKDVEKGGSGERNTTIGVGFRIPISSLLGPQAKFYASELERVNSVYRFQKNQSELEREKALTSESSIVIALNRFNYENINKIQKAVSETEFKVLQGWIQISQWLEFERQMHYQIEETYNIQISALEYMLRVCAYYQCPIREFVGGSL